MKKLFKNKKTPLSKINSMFFSFYGSFNFDFTPKFFIKFSVKTQKQPPEVFCKKRYS